MSDRRAAAFGSMGAGLLAITSVALIFAIDALVGLYEPPRPILAIVDEAAHAAMAILVLRALGFRLTGPALAGVLVGAVLIDVDHVPMELGDWDVLTRDTTRPYSHSLLGIMAVMIVAGLVPPGWRPVAVGAVFGLAMHLIRDMATGGVPLFWPLTARSVVLPYVAYMGLLIGAASAVAWRERPRQPAREGALRRWSIDRLERMS